MKEILATYTVLNKLNVIALSVLVFLIPIYQKALSPAIAIWILSSIIVIIKDKNKFELNKGLIYMLTFYCFLILGLFWKDNTKAGGFDLEVKMSLLIFPLLFSFLRLSLNNIKWVFLSYIYGLIIKSILYFIDSFQSFISTSNPEELVYVNFTKTIHPSYYSFFLVVGIIILLVDLKYKVIRLFKSNTVYISIGIVLFLFNVLTLSKVGMLVSVFVVLYFTLIWTVEKRKYVSGLFIIILLFGVFFMSYKNSNYFKQRVNELVVGLKSQDANNNGSTAIRLKVWSESVSLIKDSPFIGYGTGDVKDVLMYRYKMNNIQLAYQKKYNAHNQFLQTSISVGLIGLIIFLLALYGALYNGFKTKNYYSLGFVIVSILFMIPESVLENQAGTIFFGLFFSLLSQKSLSTSWGKQL